MGFWTVEQADCVAWLDAQPAQSADLILGSPPYLDARTYGINAVYGCYEWVEWMLRVTEAAVRVSKGLVLWVVSGVTRGNCYWPGCEGLAWEWWKRGGQLWRPCVWWKVDENDGGTGIPGSGGNVPGKRWLRADWEYVLCFKGQGGIPHDHPEVMGHAPVYSSVGGAMSNRTADGRRINAAVGERLTDGRLEYWNAAGEEAADDPWKTASRGGKGCGGRRRNGEKQAGPKVMPPGPVHDGEGNIVRAAGRPFPKIANHGNVLALAFEDGLVVKARVGGGHIGSALAHDNEAPYPEKLAEFFVRSFCPEGGMAVDCFSGSGTTAAVCRRFGRNFRGCDLRQSQVELSLKRIEQERTLFETTDLAGVTDEV